MSGLIDDATGKITDAKFDHNESVEAVFTFGGEYVELTVYLQKYILINFQPIKLIIRRRLITLS